ncbi:MAG: DUF4199 domain-containing protein [Bacteroidia bacterium]
MEYYEHTTTTNSNLNAYKPESTFHWSRPLAINFGLGTGLAMTLFMLITYLASPSAAVIFRYANLFIMAGGAFLALGSFYKLYSRSNTSYLSGLTMGMAVSGVGAALLSVFTYLTLTFGNSDAASTIVELLPIANINTAFISFILFFETALLGIVGSFIAMQFYKDNRDVAGDA